MSKRAGILLPIFSLPGKYGIGALGKAALRFIDELEAAGQNCWQLLPLGPTGFGDSPYQSFSAFAGNPYFVDLEELTEEGLLTAEECEAVDFGSDETRIDYEKMYQGRFQLLRLAYRRWLTAAEDECSALEQLLGGLDEAVLQYCEFMVLKDMHSGASWDVWPGAYRSRESEAMKELHRERQQELGFYAFVQQRFMEQWALLRDYAGQKGIALIGDIPIYVAYDSADVWANQQLFQLDRGGHPTMVAGVPPDAFSADGQLWGNPLYRWELHEQEGFAWWIRRMESSLSFCDYIRIDHFRGFESYYAVPFGAENAIEGEWMPGPGMKLFSALSAHFGRELPLIAEDLGIITPEVEALMQTAGYPGMKVLQFAWDSGPENRYLPHNLTDGHCVYYTGTHDNDSLRHWFDTLPEAQRDYIYTYMSRSGNDWWAMPELMIKLILGSVADTVIIPAADYLSLGEEARINEPATTGRNWQWRMKTNAFSTQRLEEIRQMCAAFGRGLDFDEQVLKHREAALKQAQTEAASAEEAEAAIRADLTAENE